MARIAAIGAVRKEPRLCANGARGHSGRGPGRRQDRRVTETGLWGCRHRLAILRNPSEESIISGPYLRAKKKRSHYDAEI